MAGIIESLPDSSASINFYYTFDSGQAFRWTATVKGFIGVVENRVVQIKGQGNQFLLLSNKEKGLLEWFEKYFCLEIDFEKTLAEIDVDPFIHRAIEKYRGLRLLRQEPWETLASFIISSNNNIPRIKALIEVISRHLGEPMEFQGNIYYSFPTPESILKVGENKLREFGLGFRAPYLIEAARFVEENPDWVEKIEKSSTEEGRILLKSLKGVGDKIADCVLLYAFSKLDAFPKDVWINRVLSRIYFGGKKISPSQLEDFLTSHFGPKKGIAQLYLYYWARRNALR